jgi:hypothetical protein
MGLNTGRGAAEKCSRLREGSNARTTPTPARTSKDQLTATSCTALSCGTAHARGERRQTFTRTAEPCPPLARTKLRPRMSAALATIAVGEPRGDPWHGQAPKVPKFRYRLSQSGCGDESCPLAPYPWYGPSPVLEASEKTFGVVTASQKSPAVTNSASVGDIVCIDLRHVFGNSVGMALPAAGLAKPSSPSRAREVAVRMAPPAT